MCGSTVYLNLSISKANLPVETASETLREYSLASGWVTINRMLLSSLIWILERDDSGILRSLAKTSINDLKIPFILFSR